MTESELVEKMTRELFILPDQAKRAIAIIKGVGYKSPEEVKAIHDSILKSSSYTRP